MVVNPLISLQTDTTNGYLEVIDITDYSSYTHPVAILIAYSNDAFASDVHTDMGNPYPGRWTIAVDNQKTYTVDGFYFHTYESTLNLNFGQWSIVFYGGFFYVLTQDVTKNPSIDDLRPSEDPANWTALIIGNPVTVDTFTTLALTEAELVTLCLDSINTHACPIGVITATQYIDYQIFSLMKKDCDSWLITINVASFVGAVALLDYERSKIKDLALSGGTIDVDLTEYGDGVYYIGIEFYLTDPGTYVDINTVPMPYNVFIPIVELCDAQECFKALLKYSMCHCDDPCDDCDKGNTARYSDMNMIRELITTIKEMVYMEKSLEIGYYSMAEAGDGVYAEIGQMIKKLKVITERCGLCDPDKEDNNSNC